MNIVSICCWFASHWCGSGSFHFEAYPDPTFHFDVDPDICFQFDAEPDPTFYFDADPDHTFHFDVDSDPVPRQSWCEYAISDLKKTLYGSMPPLWGVYVLPFLHFKPPNPPITYKWLRIFLMWIKWRPRSGINLWRSAIAVCWWFKVSVADPGCLSRIPDPDFYPSRIPDLGSRIQKQLQKRGVKKNVLSYLFM